jgi:MFS transporter, DHA1 family, multidrug resistance protein
LSEVPGSARTGRLIVILGSLAALAPLAIDMYLPAFPGISAFFGVELSRVQLSLASFFVGVALGQLLYGPAADRFGRKPCFYAGLLVYLAASAYCTFAPTVEALIVARFFQAIGACSGMVVSRAVVRDLFGYRESARVFSLLMLVMGVAPILAPVAGTFLTDAFGWRSIFWVQAAFAVFCLAGVAAWLPETRGPDRSVRLRTILPAYRAVFRDRRFLGYSLTLATASSSMFAYITGSPFVFLEHFGITKQGYGLLFGSNALGLILVSQLNARWVKSIDPDRILGRGLVIVSVLGLALTAAGLTDARFWVLTPTLFCYIATLGMVGPNVTASALADQKERAGTASALMGTLQFGVSALVSTAVSSIHDDTALPMTAVMGACAISALLIHRLVARRA